MAKNFVQNGDTITVVSPSGGVSSGDPVLIVEIFGVATHDAVATADLELALSGVFTLPADTNLVIAQGDRVFWDAANGWVDKTASAQVAVGRAVVAKGLTDATIDVLLGGSTPAGT